MQSVDHESLLDLRIGGVPEHFNLPWHLLLASAAPQQTGIKPVWQSFPAGTGAMVNALNSASLDFAMLVTEGAVAAQQQPDCQFELVSFYTVSPLLWGIHVPADSDIHSTTDLHSHRYAISRYGSGSHLMAKIHAHSLGWNTADLEFVLVENLAGARHALNSGQAEVFFWERFTTKPYVDNGEFRWLGNFPPLWPGFTICVRSELIARHESAIHGLIELVQQQAQRLKQRPDAVPLIAERYALKPADVSTWLDHTHWADRCALDDHIISQVQLALATA